MSDAIHVKRRRALDSTPLAGIRISVYATSDCAGRDSQEAIGGRFDARAWDIQHGDLIDPWTTMALIVFSSHT
jgi:hypothetical protein